MQRRSLIAAFGSLPFVSLAPVGALANLTTPAVSGRWRSFEIIQTVKLPADSGRTRLWLPLPHESSWQRVEQIAWRSNAAEPALVKEAKRGVAAFYAEWPEGGSERTVELKLRIATLNRGVEPKSLPIST